MTKPPSTEGWLLGALLLALVIAVGVQVAQVSVRSLLGFASGPMPSHASLLFVGDIMLDRYVRELAERKGYASLFEGVRDELQSVDMVIANLEGPVTAQHSVSYGTRSTSDPGHMRFTFATSTGELLRSVNINAVSLGNNHILDFGSAGYKETVQHLDRFGVLWFGSPYATSSNMRLTEVEGIRIAFIAFNQFLGRDVAYTERLIHDAVSRADVVVVFAHWGEEYEEEPTSYTVPWAKRFVDAGADLVIGAHPHVVMPYEEYKGVRIYYSLGNFIFDQYWMPEVRCGLGVRVDIEKYLDQPATLIFSETEFGRDREGNTFVGCK